MPKPDYDSLFKILLIGDSGSGKSSAMLRFCEDKFSPSFISTIGIDFRVKTITLEDGTRVKLQCWDTAGQERFRTITTAFFRGANGIMVMYDVTDDVSFANISHWMKTVDTNSADLKLGLTRMLVATKCDLNDRRLISTETGRELAKTLSKPGSPEVLYAEISAKLGLGVAEAFTSMATAMRNNDVAAKKQQKQMFDPYTDASKDVVSLREDSPQPNTSSTCC